MLEQSHLLFNSLVELAQLKPKVGNILLKKHSLSLLINTTNVTTIHFIFKKKIPQEKRIKWQPSPDVQLSRFIVPSSASLSPSLSLLSTIPAPSSTAITSTSRTTSRSAGGGAGNAQDRDGAGNKGHLTLDTASYTPANHMYIGSFYPDVDVAQSKAKPKIVSLLTVCGR